MTTVICAVGSGWRVLLDRHERECDDPGCAGCVPCTAPHCWDDGETHLDFEHPLTCPKCLSRHRGLLEDIGDQAARLRERLPDHAQDGIPGSNSILGGNAMVLLGQGSEGAYWTADHSAHVVPTYACSDCGSGGILDPSRHLLERHCPPQGGPLWLADASMFTFEGERVVEPNGNDNHLYDPESVLFTLQRVEDDWRSLLGHPAALSQDIPASIAYLTRHIHWAAQRFAGHDGAWYPDLVEEWRTLRGRLNAELGNSDPTIRGVQCLNDNCAGLLLRLFTKPDPCNHQMLAGEVHVCDQGGRRDWWVCSDCDDTYSLDRYNQAVAQLHLDQDPLRTAGQLQQMWGIKPDTVRQWAARGLVGRHDNPARPGHSLYDANEVREQAQRGGLLRDTPESA